MGIDYRAKVMYGFWMDDVENEELREELKEAVDMGDIEYAAPYYDASRDECFVGLDVPMFNLSKEQCIQKVLEIVEEAEGNDLLKKVTDSGVQLVVNCSPNVY